MNLKKRKITVISLFCLLIALLIGLVSYELINTKTLSSNTVLRGILLLGSAIIVLIKGLYGTNAKINYKKYESAYKDEIAYCFNRDDSKKERKALLEGIHLFNIKAYEKAIEKLEALEKKCQTSGDFYGTRLFLALSYQDMGAWDKAIEIYEKMVRNGTPRATPWTNLGVLYDERGRLDEAIRCYKGAIEIEKSNPTVYCNMGNLLAKAGEYEGALEYASRAVSIKYNHADALELMAYCYSALGDFAECEKYYKRAVESGANPSSLRRAIDFSKNASFSNCDREEEE